MTRDTFKQIVGCILFAASILVTDAVVGHFHTPGEPLTAFWNLLLPAVSALLGAFSKSKSKSREAQAEAAVEQEKLGQGSDRDYYAALVNRERENRATKGDAWKRLQQASYVSNWQQPKASFSPYTRALTAPSADVMSASKGIYADTLGQATGNAESLIPLPDRRAPFAIPGTKPGIWETLVGLAGTGLSVYDAVKSANKKSTPTA